MRGSHYSCFRAKGDGGRGRPSYPIYMGGLCFITVPISNLDCCRGKRTDLGRRQEPTTPHSNAPLSLSICLFIYPAIGNLCV